MVGARSMLPLGISLSQPRRKSGPAREQGVVHVVRTHGAVAAVADAATGVGGHLARDSELVRAIAPATGHDHIRPAWCIQLRLGEGESAFMLFPGQDDAGEVRPLQGIEQFGRHRRVALDHIKEDATAERYDQDLSAPWLFVERSDRFQAGRAQLGRDVDGGINGGKAVIGDDEDVGLR